VCKCTISSVSCHKNEFKLLPSGETFISMFEIRILEGKLPSVLKLYKCNTNSHLSTLELAMVCVNSRITYVSKEFLASNIIVCTNSMKHIPES
jgi:hypothetical protein